METLEKDALVNALPVGVEIASLRQEVLLRVFLQNIILQMVVVLFVTSIGLTVFRPGEVWAISLGYQTASLACALQWCHHGIRTRQIKQFLTRITPVGNAPSWEAWLPANRPPGLLGSRWLISTKGVFLGLSLTMIGLELAIADSPVVIARVGGIALWLLTTCFLLTNPKE